MRKARGFTLIELAIVLVILTVIAGGLLVPLTKRIEMQRYEDTRKLLDLAQAALIGYTMSNRISGSNRSYLPCPDINQDGVEDRTGDSCSQQQGRLPWVTLGLNSLDAWGNHIDYAVHDDFSDKSPAKGISNSTKGDFRICAISSNCSGVNLLAEKIPFIVLSRGPNGKGALSANGTLIAWAPATTSADENENLNNGSTYVSRPPTPAESALGEFDDLVVWLSTPALLARICPAGGCP